MLDPFGYSSVFDAGPKPHVGQNLAYLAGHQIGHSLWPFREYLIVVVRRLAHDLPYIENEVVADLFVEQIAHGIDEDLARVASP